MPAKRHHYIPQFYLKGFAKDREKPRLFAIDLEAHRSFSASTKDLAVEEGFHKVDVPGQPADFVESTFSRIEAVIAESLRRVVDARSIADATDRALLFFLMSLILTRHPIKREYTSGTMAEIAKRTGAATAANPEAWAASMERMKADGVFDESDDLEALRQLILTNDFHIRLSTEAHIGIELELAQKIYPCISARKWKLLRTTGDPSGFVCSDSPVAIEWLRPMGEHTPGFGLRDTAVIFPVSADLAMVGAFEFPESVDVDADNSMVAATNAAIIRNALRFIYSRDDQFVYSLREGGKFKKGDQLLGEFPEPASSSDP